MRRQRMAEDDDRVGIVVLGQRPLGDQSHPVVGEDRRRMTAGGEHGVGGDVRHGSNPSRGWAGGPGPRGDGLGLGEDVVLGARPAAWTRPTGQDLIRTESASAGRPGSPRRAPVAAAPAGVVPVATPLTTVGAIGPPGHDVRGSRADLLLAAGAAVGLRRCGAGDRVDVPVAVGMGLHVRHPGGKPQGLLLVGAAIAACHGAILPEGTNTAAWFTASLGCPEPVRPGPAPRPDAMAPPPDERRPHTPRDAGQGTLGCGHAAQRRVRSRFAGGPPARVPDGQRAVARAASGARRLRGSASCHPTCRGSVAPRSAMLSPRWMRWPTRWPH